MTGFFIKKAFFDGWDHLWGLVLLNLGVLALLALFVLVPLTLGLPGSVVWICVGALLLFAYSAVCAAALKDVADYKNLNFPAFLAALKAQGPYALFYGAVLLGLGAILFVAAPFYLSQGTPFAWFAFGTLFWCALAILLALQWFPAVRVFLPGPLKTTLRKCFLLMADNLLFSLFLWIYTLLNVAISVFTAFLIPGVAGTTLGTVDALKLLLKKYDWLEAHPQANRRKIPWAELLEEEQELVGKRTFKGMIFPWKE